MALSREYLESLGLEIAKRKYYNAARVESVIEELSRRSAALEEENVSLRKRIDSMSYSREEICEAILSAKTIAQHLVAEAREEADGILAGAREEAARTLAEAEERHRVLFAECDGLEQKTIRNMENCYLQIREQGLSSVKLLDEEWRRFLCSFGEGAAQKADPALPEDLAERLGAIAESFSELRAEDEEPEG